MYTAMGCLLLCYLAHKRGLNIEMRPEIFQDIGNMIARSFMTIGSVQQLEAHSVTCSLARHPNVSTQGDW